MPVDRDADLVAALRRDDSDAVEQLVDRYGEHAYRLAMQIVGVQADAERAAEDALSASARKIAMLDRELPFGAWVSRLTAKAAYHTLLARRAAAGDIALEDVVPPLDGDGRHFEPMDDWSIGLDEHALPGAMRQALMDAIEALPPDYRTALVLHDVENMADADIAEALGIPASGVRSRVHRARLFVRKRLSNISS